MGKLIEDDYFRDADFGLHATRRADRDAPAIRYVSRFRYPESGLGLPQRASGVSHERRVQRLLDYRLDIEPAANVSTYVDSWGTRIDEYRGP